MTETLRLTQEEQDRMLLKLAHELGLDKKYVNMTDKELRRSLEEYDKSIRDVLYSLKVNIRGKHRLANMVQMEDRIFFIKNGLRDSSAVYDYEDDKIYGCNHDPYIKLSLLHEDIHYLGTHGKFSGVFNIETKENEAFNECMTEYITWLVWFLMTEEDIGYTSYDAQIEVLEPFFMELGLKKLLDIYFNNKIDYLKRIFERRTNYSWKEFNEKFDKTLRNPIGIEETIYAELDELKEVFKND